MSGGTLLLAAIAACAGVIGLFLFRASPRLTVVVWLVALFFIPVWIGVSIGFFWSAITFLTIAAILTNLSDIRFTTADFLMGVFALLVVVLFAVKTASLSATVIALLEWVVPYVWGRLIFSRVDRTFVVKAIASVATVAAVLALLEFATGTNVFVMLPAMSADLYGTWGDLQIRADRLRVEGAWGHSIALGSAFAMSSAFVVAARWPVAVRMFALGLIAVATVATISRIGMLTLAATVALSVVLLPGVGRAMRWSVAVMGVVGAAIIIPFVGGVFAEAGDEAGGSADYRSALFSLVSQVHLVGSAGDWTGLTVGGDYLGAFAKSVDNAFLVFALRFGWIPAVALLATLVFAAALMLRRRTTSPAAIAVAAQLPALFAVALITQAGMYLWFLAGLSVAWSQRAAIEAAADQSEGASFLSISRMNDASVFASRR